MTKVSFKLPIGLYTRYKLNSDRNYVRLTAVLDHILYDLDTPERVADYYQENPKVDPGYNIVTLTTEFPLTVEALTHNQRVTVFAHMLEVVGAMGNAMREHSHLPMKEASHV